MRAPPADPSKPLADCTRCVPIRLCALGLAGRPLGSLCGAARETAPEGLRRRHGREPAPGPGRPSSGLFGSGCAGRQDASRAGIAGAATYPLPPSRTRLEDHERREPIRNRISPAARRPWTDGVLRNACTYAGRPSPEPWSGPPGGRLLPHGTGTAHAVITVWALPTAVRAWYPDRLRPQAAPLPDTGPSSMPAARRFADGRPCLRSANNSLPIEFDVDVGIVTGLRVATGPAVAAGLGVAAGHRVAADHRVCRRIPGRQGRRSLRCGRRSSSFLRGPAGNRGP